MCIGSFAGVSDARRPRRHPRACATDTIAALALDSLHLTPYKAPASRALTGLSAAAQVAQLVEHVTENHGVGGSIPPLGTSTSFHICSPRRIADSFQQLAPIRLLTVPH